MYLSFLDLVKMSIFTDETTEVECKITLHVSGESRIAYACSVSYRDLMFYTDQGTVTYLVDVYGDRITWEIHDWECEDTVCI